MNQKFSDDLWVINQSRLILRSYEHWLAKPLISSQGTAEEIASQLFNAPFAVLSSDAAPDPLLNYGNQLTLTLWETSWEDLRRTWGRDTAETLEQDDRSRFLSDVKKNGYALHYEGIRISKKGRRFRIKNAVIWNLIDEKGCYAGQAAAIPEWEWL